MLWGAAQRARTASSWLARSPARRSSCGRGSSAVPSNRTRVAAATRTTEEASWSRGIGVVYGVSCVGVCFPPALRRPLLLSPSRSAPAGRAARDRGRPGPGDPSALPRPAREHASAPSSRRRRGARSRPPVLRRSASLPSSFILPQHWLRLDCISAARHFRDTTRDVNSLHNPSSGRGVMTPLNHSSPWGTACEG